MKKKWRLLSTEFFHTPGILKWGINGYKFPEDRPKILNVFTSGWPTIPSEVFDRLLKGKLPYKVIGDSVDIES